MSEEHTNPERLFPEERRQTILDQLEYQPKVLVKDLAAEFGVSQFTIRADLDQLEDEGRLLRCHGGALSVNKSGIVADYSKRLGHMPQAKRSIGALAATLVNDGDSISVDTGTTTIEMIRCLDPQINVTIVTNDFSIGSLVDELLPNARLYFLGGLVRRGYHWTATTTDLAGLACFNTDKAFLSATGFTVDGGFMSEDPEQAKIKREYLESARKRYVLLDSSKFNHVSFIRYATPADVDGIITETMPDDAVRESIRLSGNRCKLMIAE